MKLPQRFLHYLLASLLYFTINVDCYSQTDQLDNFIVKEISCNENEGSVTFIYTSKSSGLHSLILWQSGISLFDETYNSYQLEINGIKIPTLFQPQNNDWYALRVPFPISLEKGENTIKILTPLPIVPNIERIECISINANILSNIELNNSYSQYATKIKKSLSVKTDLHPFQPTQDTLNIIPNAETSPYEYLPGNISWFGYTFSTKVYLKANQRVSLKTQSWNCMLHYLEIYKLDEPDKFSITSISDSNGVCSKTIVIPISGIYEIRLRPYKNYSVGIVSLIVNNTFEFRNMPISSSGLSYDLWHTDVNYHFFTSKSKGNPSIFLLEGSATDGKVINYNHDYNGQGNFTWGKEARINYIFSKGGRKALIINSGSSFYPEGECEVYFACRKACIPQYMYDYMMDDAIRSAPGDTLYNCISWAGGIHSYWEWPTLPLSTYYSSDSELSCFDNFFSSERYPGCTRYERVESMEENIGVDLWGLKFKDSYSIKHASISKYSDSNFHGYEWESKLGAGERVFHQRNDLKGISYGSVLFHYVPIANENNPSSLEYAISDGLAIMGNVEVPHNQYLFLQESISQINLIEKNSLYDLCNKYEQTFNEGIYSNYSWLTELPEYKAIINKINQNDKLKYIIFEKITYGHHCFLPLLLEVISNDLPDVNKKIEEIKKTLKKRDNTINGKFIVYTPLDIAKALLISILGNEIDSKNQITFNANELDTVSNTESKFQIIRNSDSLNIEFDNQYISEVKLDVLDIYGNLINELLPLTRLETGKYVFNQKMVSKIPILIRKYQNGNIEIYKLL